MILGPVIKQPAERSLVRFEFGQPAGAAISSIVSAAVTAAGRVPELVALSIGSQIAGSTYAQLRIEGGTVGELYSLRCLVEDAAANRFEQDREVLVLDLAFRAEGSVAGYLSLEGFVARAGVDLCVRLTDEAGAGMIDARRLEAALLDAQATIDSHLAGKYAVPLALPAPAPLPTIAYDLTLARLYSAEVPEAVAARQRDALRQLADLRDGKQLIAAPAAASQTDPKPILVREGGRLFTRESLRGF